MIRSKTKRKIAARSHTNNAAKRKSSKRPLASTPNLMALAKMRAGTKNGQVIAMLQDRAGTTVAAIAAVTGWQQHSVRGFLAGDVRKKLGLNLVSEASDSGRVYRIIDGAAKSTSDGSSKQAALMRCWANGVSGLPR